MELLQEFDFFVDQLYMMMRKSEAHQVNCLNADHFLGLILRAQIDSARKAGPDHCLNVKTIFESQFGYIFVSRLFNDHRMDSRYGDLLLFFRLKCRSPIFIFNFLLVNRFFWLHGLLLIQLYLLFKVRTNQIQQSPVQSEQQKMSRVNRVSEQESLNTYTYGIRIISVKMKVKFQCKMKIQMDSEPITTEVPVSDGSTFLFNQDCSLVQKNLTEDCFTLSVNLVTNKGAKYIAGLAVIYHQELARAADMGLASRIVVTLSKCLDPEAILQFVVKQAVRNGRKKYGSPGRQQVRSKRGKTNIEMSQIESRKVQHSPPLSPRGYQYGLQHATRSQINLPRAIGGARPYDPALSKVGSINKEIRSRSKRNISNSRERAINSFGFAFTERDRITVDYIEENKTERDHAYKDSYSKLKERLKKEEQQVQKQHEKRVSLETNEAASRIQVLKYKLKCEELEKNVTDKSGNIKKLEQRIEELERLIRGEAFDQRHNFQINNLRSFSTNHLSVPVQKIVTVAGQNDSAISVLESKVALANRELEELKNKTLRMSRTNTDRENGLMKEIEKKNARIAKLEEEIFESRNSLSSNTKNDEQKKILIEQKQKIIGQMEREQEEYYRKLSESERTNKILERNLEELRIRTQELNRNLNIVTSQKTKLVEQIQAEKNKTNMSEFTVSALKKNVERLENELQSMQKIKEKYHDGLVEMKRIEGERKLEQKGYESSIKIATNNASTLQLKYKQEAESLHRKNQDLQSRLLQQMARTKELQSHINSTVKHEVENYRKMNEKLQRDCEEYRNGERMLRKEQSNVQSKLNQLTSEVEVWKNKYKSLENISKLESDKYMNELNRMKSNLEQQLMNQMAIKQKNQSLSTQLAITTNKLSSMDEKYQKEIKDYGARIEMEINKNTRLQEMMRKYEQMGVESKDKEKQLISKIEQYGENQSQYTELIKRYEHEMARIKSALAITEEKLTTKQEQGEELSRQLKQMTQKHNIVSQKCQEVSYSLKNTSSELEKEQKQRQKLELQLVSLKMGNENKDKTIEKQKNSIDQEVKVKMELKEQFGQLNASYETLIKEYERFKEHIYDTLLREFTGVDGLDTLGNFVIKTRDNHTTLKESVTENMKNSQKLYGRNNFEQTKISKSVRNLNYQSMSPSNLGHSPSAPSISLSNNDILGIVNQFSKQSKALLNRMIEEYRVLEKEMDFLKESFQQKETKYSEDQSKAEINIHQLQEQISKIFAQKEGLEKKLDHTTHNLEQQIFKLKQEAQRTIEKLEESIFTCNGVRMEKETEKQFYEIKINQLSTTIIKMENSLTGLSSKCMKLEEAFNKAKYENEDLTRQNRKLKDDIEGKEKKIRELDNELYSGARLIEDLNAKNKQIISQVSELEILLSHEKEKNGRNMEIISEEQKKLSTTKDFLNNLIKQKEALVKQDISNGHKIIELQSGKLNLQSQLQSTTSKLQQKTSELSIEKENTKKLNSTIRQLEAQLVAQRDQIRKANEQAKQKQKQQASLFQTARNRESQLTKQIQNKNREVQQLNSNKQLSDKLRDQQASNYKKQISKLEEEILQLKEQIKMLNAVQQMTAKELDTTSRSVEQKSYQINSYRQIQQKLSSIRQKQEQNINSLLEELKEKEEQLFNTASTLYTLEQRFNQQQEAYKLEQEHLAQEYGYKYDSMCEDYETKLDEMERERDYLKGKLASVEEEATKLSNRVRTMEEEEARQRAMWKDKLGRLEEEKNLVISTFKVDMKKLTEDGHRMEAQIKKKDIELDKLRSSELVDKNIIFKLEARAKECEIKLEQQQGSLYGQQQNEKKKDLYIKQYEESVVNFQWMLQREVKKELQNVTKVIIGSNTESSENKRRYTDAIKDVETRVSRLVSQRIIVSHQHGSPSRSGN